MTAVGVEVKVGVGVKVWVGGAAGDGWAQKNSSVPIRKQKTTSLRDRFRKVGKRVKCFTAFRQSMMFHSLLRISSKQENFRGEGKKRRFGPT